MSLRSWFYNFPLSQFIHGFAQEFASSILNTGPVPQHIAFIMDGNRRFAKMNGLELGEGHVAGFESLSNVSVVFFFSPIIAKTLDIITQIVLEF